jgi:cation diffusion facilitator family transporter
VIAGVHDVSADAAKGMLTSMNVISGAHCTTSFPLNVSANDVSERRQANRAIAVSALGLALTGFIELAIAVVSGSVALLSDGVNRISDVSTCALVFFGFRASRKIPSKRHPYGYERAEDLAGIGVALVIWASAIVAGVESVTKLLDHGGTADLGWGIAAAAVGIAGNLLVAAYKFVIGRRIHSATIVADAKHSGLDALCSAGVMLGLVGVAFGWGWADAVAGIVVTGFICYIGWKVTADIAHRLLDGVDPNIITTAETIATTVLGVSHAHARARWTGRTLRIEVEAFLHPNTTIAQADQIGYQVATALTPQIPEMRSFTWTARSLLTDRSTTPRPCGDLAAARTMRYRFTDNIVPDDSRNSSIHRGTQSRTPQIGLQIIPA